MPGKRLYAILLGVASATLSTTSTLGQEPYPKHPAEPASPWTPPMIQALELAVPLIDRALPQPSYGPAPSDAPAAPLAAAGDVPETDHSGHHMPSMNHGATPEGLQ